MKPTSMDKENNKRIYEDSITNSGIMLNTKGEMYLIKDGKKMRLNAFIIKQSRRESN
tara:strand:+ start:295 stop:465 length:171 start_codon:yes stop_codon:yes gene_type:complete